MVKHTPGPWTSRALGGHSVVLCPTLPDRNDNRAKVGYGYRGEAFSIAYPFLDDDDRVRMDFVSFSHGDARLIAAAPDLLEALKHARSQMQHPDQMIDEAIAKAEGKTNDHS